MERWNAYWSSPTTPSEKRFSTLPDASSTTRLLNTIPTGLTEHSEPTWSESSRRRKSLLRRNARSRLKFLAANLYLLVNRCLDYTRCRQVCGASERTDKITVRVEELMIGAMACVRIAR